METKLTLLIISIFLYNVLGCDPINSGQPLWTSPDGYWSSVIGKTTKNSPGLVLYDDQTSRLRHFFLTGASDWVDNLTSLYTNLMANDIVYMNPLKSDPSPHVVRVDANTGILLPNLTFTVHNTEGSLLDVRLECNNVLYSMYGERFLYSLVANDASTGEWIMQTSFNGIIQYNTIVISDDCKYVTFVLDPLDNTKNFTLVRLDAKTGNLIWEVQLVNRASAWDWYAYENDDANRIAVVRYILLGTLYSAYTLQLYTLNSGMITFEKSYSGKQVYFSPIVFSKDASLVFFSPLESNCIKISGNADAQVWSTGVTEGMVSSTYISDSSKTVLFSIWNYGNTKFIAQNTKDGSTLWESPWEIFVSSPIIEFGNDLFVFTGEVLYALDTKKCPLI